MGQPEYRNRFWNRFGSPASWRFGCSLVKAPVTVAGPPAAPGVRDRGGDGQPSSSAVRLPPGRTFSFFEADAVSCPGGARCNGKHRPLVVRPLTVLIRDLNRDEAVRVSTPTALAPFFLFSVQQELKEVSIGVPRLRSPE